MVAVELLVSEKCMEETEKPYMTIDSTLDRYLTFENSIKKICSNRLKMALLIQIC